MLLATRNLWVDVAVPLLALPLLELLLRHLAGGVGAADLRACRFSGALAGSGSDLHFDALFAAAATLLLPGATGWGGHVRS